MIQLICVLVVVGVILWALCTYIPMNPIIKNLIIGVAVICCVVYILQAFGVWGGGHDIPVPKLR